MIKYILNILFVFLSLVTFAQGDTETTDFFKSNLKIYVVVAVLAIILTCLFVFMFAIEKRLKALEDKN